MVLTQLDVTADCYSGRVRVSIPLWFSRNVVYGDGRVITSLEFPYHYGSHATRSAPWTVAWL